VTFGAEDRKAINKKSLKQEQRSAGAYKGSRNAGSGSGWLRKNDVRSETLLIENKLTIGTKSITIKEVDLRELRERAIIEDRIPVLQFDLNNRHYVVLIEDDFLAMIEETND
jgi:Ulp1 family protease